MLNCVGFLLVFAVRLNNDGRDLDRGAALGPTVWPHPRSTTMAVGLGEERGCPHSCGRPFTRRLAILVRQQPGNFAIE